MRRSLTGFGVLDEGVGLEFGFLDKQDALLQHEGVDGAGKEPAIVNKRSELDGQLFGDVSDVVKDIWRQNLD